MIQFQKEDQEVLTRLLNDRDFEYFLNRLESEMYRMALANQRMEGTPLHREQGAVLAISAIIDGAKDAPKRLARLKEKRQ